jgi:hypothetical protein
MNTTHTMSQDDMNKNGEFTLIPSSSVVPKTNTAGGVDQRNGLSKWSLSHGNVALLESRKQGALQKPSNSENVANRCVCFAESL